MRRAEFSGYGNNDKIGLAQSPTTVFWDNMGETEWADGGIAKRFLGRRHIGVRHNYAISLITKRKIVL